MADKSGIEWTDATWNPIRGCSRVSEGCKNCYAEKVANRFKGPGKPYEGLIASGGQWNGKITVVDHLMDQPLRWKKPRRIFVNSMSDLFHENVPEHTIDSIFAVMAMANQHTFQVLTKRPERMLEYLTDDRRKHWATRAVNFWGGENPDPLFDSIHGGNRVLPNVWLGVSAEDQKTADERIPLLQRTPAAVRWLSAEPLLGSIDLTKYCHIEGLNQGHSMMLLDNLDWVVVGGESGPNARVMQADWARTLRSQCTRNGIPFFFKQWGEYAPNWFNDNEGRKIYGSEWMDRMGKKAAGRYLDSRTWSEYPPQLNMGKA